MRGRPSWRPMSSITSSVAVAVRASSVRIAERAQRGAEAAVGRPEVVAPLRDAVRLVHHEEVDRALLELVEKVAVGELLGRGEDELGLAAPDARERLAPLALGEHAVDGGGLQPALAELVGLVLHERDERRDHDRGALHVQRGQLVAQRLAGAGRHDGERVAASEHALDHFALTRPQAPQPEPAAQEFSPVLHHARAIANLVPGKV